MNATEVHLLVNHLPIVGAFLGLALVLLAVLRRNERHTIQAATLVLLLSGGGGIAAYFSGEEAEHAAEERPGFDHDVLEEHEDGAKPALALLLLAGAIGGGLSYLSAKGRAVPVAASASWVIATLVAVGMMTRMGLTGREVGHPDQYGANATVGAGEGHAPKP